MKVCIFGAGAIGSHVAARLNKAGCTVSIVARGAHLDAIRRDGLSVRAPDTEWHGRLAASDDPAVLGVQDLVIVAVKAPAHEAAATAIKPLLGPETSVVFATNGIPWWYFQGIDGAPPENPIARLDPSGKIKAAVAPERVIGCVAYTAAEVTRPGLVTVTYAGQLVLGEPDGRQSARTEAIASKLQAGGLACSVTGEIRKAVWTKLTANLATGPTALLTGSTVAQSLEDPACADAARRIIAEIVTLAAAYGCTIPNNAEPAIEHGRKMNFHPSIVRDLESGRPLETDALFEAPLDLARAAGVAMPTLELLNALVRLRVRRLAETAAPAK